MPRRLPKRPVYAVKSAEWKPVGADNDYVIEPAKWWPQISESQWVEIQTVYGRELVPDVRREILESTYRFAVLAQMESTGVPAADVTDEIERIRNTANTLFAALTAEGDAALLAHEWLEQNGIDLDRLRGLLIVLEHEYGKLSVPRPHKAGDAWDDWVRELTAICDKSGLYIEARQDDKAETNPSEFVALIEKLQTFLLPPLRRHTHSRTALAGAINRAREVRNA